jgi:hypothetical protein
MARFVKPTEGYYPVVAFTLLDHGTMNPIVARLFTEM